MRDFYRINSENDYWFPYFHEIYKNSFPLHEQRSKEQQLYAFQHPNYHLDCLIDNNTLMAFVAYWDFEQYIYIEHYAVNPLFRGKNIGTHVLQNFFENHPKLIILEIDPLEDEVSKKRLLFYQKLGFVENAFTHFHPAYSPEFPPHQLIVLSHKIPLGQKQYDSFLQDLETVVMNNDQ